MAEKKFKVKVYEVDYICDDCGEGVMRHTGMCLTSYPVQYPHECENCGTTKNFRNIYPYINYKRKGEEDEATF